MQPYALQSDENYSWDKMSQELEQIKSIYVFFFFQLCRHQRHLVFYAYSPSKEGLNAEVLFCSCPQNMSRIWFMPFGVYIILKLGQNPHVTQLLKTWHFICHRIIVAVWVFLTSWQNNKATRRNCLYRDIPVPCCHRYGSEPWVREAPCYAQRHRPRSSCCWQPAQALCEGQK